jgi:putative transposase
MSGKIRAEGHDVGRYKARSLMKKASVSVSYKRKFKKTADSKHKLPVAENILDR